MHSSRSYCRADQLIFRARVRSLSRSRVARSTASRARASDTRACARRVRALFGILRQLLADWPRFLSTRNGRTNDGTLRRRRYRVVRRWLLVAGVPSCRINRKSESAARATRDESASHRKDVTVTCNISLAPFIRTCLSPTRYRGASVRATPPHEIRIASILRHERTGAFVAGEVR